jgi:hypothetical protein
VTPEDLIDIEEIKRLKYRYVRLLDLKEWDELAACFTEDATAAYGGGEYAYEGRNAILEFLRSNLSGTDTLTSHKVHQPEIDLIGPDRARGLWGLEDVVISTESGVTIRGSAFYTDEYLKLDGSWRISSTGYKRVYEEMEPRSSDARLTASWWGTSGRSQIPTR